MAMTAWFAKVSNRAIFLSLNGLISRRLMVSDRLAGTDQRDGQ